MALFKYKSNKRIENDINILNLKNKELEKNINSIMI